jgi:hypothetical protein
MPETRYIVEYETDGEGSARQTAFIVEKSAREFSRRITTDGRAWPSEARIFRERRESCNHEWLHDCYFQPVDYVDGDDQSSCESQTPSVELGANSGRASRDE